MLLVVLDQKNTLLGLNMGKDFEDTKDVIGIPKSKDRQNNGQKKTDKRTNNDLQNIHIKLKIVLSVRSSSNYDVVRDQ